MRHEYFSWFLFIEFFPRFYRYPVHILNSNEDMWKHHSPWQISTNRIKDLHECFLKMANMVWSFEKKQIENHEFPSFQLPFVGSQVWLFLLVWVQVCIPMAFLQYMEKYSMRLSIEIFLNPFEIFHISLRYWPEIGPRSVTVGDMTESRSIESIK